MRTEAFVFADDGDIPNSRFPLIVYRGAVAAGQADPATAFEDLFEGNGWGNGWRNGIYPFHHYHSTAHEVLGIAAGYAEVRFGGVSGQTLAVAAGDAVLIPAGVGHKRIAACHDLLVIGAYPPGQHADLMREGAEDTAAIRRRIGKVATPATDPITGRDSALAKAWAAAG